MIFKAAAGKYKILCLSLLVLLGALIYSNSFYNPFCFDDGLYITGNPAIRNIANLRAVWNYFPSRFITFVTFALNYRFNAFSVFGYHLVNLIIHLSCAMLVFWLANLILSAPLMQKDKIAAFARPFAFFAALLFLSHPIQTEAVVYIWQRSTLLVALFYLLSLCLYIKARLLQINNNASKAKVFYIFSLFSALISMFSKENSVTLPVMIILCEFYFLKKPGRIRLKPVLPFLALLPVVPAMLFFAKPETFSDIERLFYNPADTGFYYFITQLRVFITYLRLVFVPVSQNIDYDYPFMKSIFQPQVFLSLLVVIIILFVAFKLYKKYRLLSFAIIWFFVALFPESSIVPLKDIIFEHRLYLPLAAFSIFFVAALCYLFRENKTKLLISMLSIIIAVYSFMAHQRNKIWQDEVTLWTDAIHKSPNKPRVYNNRGSA
ncbi:MAG: hypothetical protein PHP17_02225, partial [Candidatus Omnitrophica bacterium]|nr:hypothetical protein [Candidatus Omnitrophota bacterium]